MSTGHFDEQDGFVDGVTQRFPVLFGAWEHLSLSLSLGAPPPGDIPVIPKHVDTADTKALGPSHRLKPERPVSGLAGTPIQSSDTDTSGPFRAALCHRSQQTREYGDEQTNAELSAKECRQ